MYEIKEQQLLRTIAAASAMDPIDTEVQHSCALSVLKTSLAFSCVSMLLARPFGLAGIAAFGVLGFSFGLGYGYFSANHHCAKF